MFTVGKYLTITVLLLSAVACTPTYINEIGKYRLPPELQDCKIYYLSSSDGGSLTVVRCPNSTVTASYRKGKTTATVIVASN